MIPWLALFVALFLAPGAIALGSMFAAIAAGGADVLTYGRPRRLRQAAVFASMAVIAAAWSMLIVWIAIHAIEELPALRRLWPAIGAIIAAAPTLALAWKAGRGGEVDEALVMPLRLPAAINAAAVVAMMVQAGTPTPTSQRGMTSSACSSANHSATSGCASKR